MRPRPIAVGYALQQMFEDLEAHADYSRGLLDTLQPGWPKKKARRLERALSDPQSSILF